MTSPRAITWTLAALAIVTAAALTGWHAIKRRAGAAVAIEEAASRTKAPSRHDAAPDHAAIADDAERSADRWVSHAAAVMRAKNTRRFNADVARLLELPPDRAWPPLVERALAGDLAAGAAALDVASLCNAPLNSNSYINGTSPNLSAKLHRSLPSTWKHFLDAIETRQRERLREDLAHCDGVGNAVDFALVLINHFFEPDDPDLRIDAANDNPDDASAIADLREIVAQTSSARAGIALGERLLESADASLRDEGRKQLERLASHDPQARIALARCGWHSPSMRGAGIAGGIAHPCHAFDDDAAAAATWIEQAAGLGDYAALASEIGSLRESGRNVDAWAWAAYRLDLAMRGCFEIGRPGFGYVGIAAEEEENLRARLDAKQQNAGRALANEIIGRSEAEATSRLDCAD